MRSNTDCWSNDQLNDRIEELEDIMEDWDSRWKYVGGQLYRAMERAVTAEEKLEAIKNYLNELEGTGNFIDKQKIMKIVEGK